MLYVTLGLNLERDDIILPQIVEELEDRLGERMNEILTHVQSSLSEAPATSGTGPALEITDLGHDEDGIFVMEDDYTQEIGAYHEEIAFDDTGEGTGIEGDLDVEED